MISSLSTTTPDEDAVCQIDGRWMHRIVERAAHYLPSQGPLSSFVHHNTLHAFEHLTFEQAVVAGQRLFHHQPYLSEQRYRQAMAEGRIHEDQLRDILLRDLGDCGDGLVAGFCTRYTLRLAMLQMPMAALPSAQLPWLLAETDFLRRFRDGAPARRRDHIVRDTRQWVEAVANTDQPVADKRDRAESAADVPPGVEEILTRFADIPPKQWSDAQWESVCLNLLWHLCRRGAEAASAVADRATDRNGLAAGIGQADRQAELLNESVIGCAAEPTELQVHRVPRHRDLVYRLTGRDPDVLVHEVLIPFCAAYVDQGLATWQLPERDAGFAHAFLALHSKTRWTDPAWLRSAKSMLRSWQGKPWDAMASITQSLDALGIRPSEQEEYVTQTLLALGGWAGMLRQLEGNAPWLPHPAPDGSLDDFLAIRLILDRFAVEAILTDWRRTSQPSRTERARSEHATREDHEVPAPSGSGLPSIDLHELVRFVDANGSVQGRRAELEEQTFAAFQLAQYIGWTPQQLLAVTPAQWCKLYDEMAAFPSLARRRLFHLAYEAEYRERALTAMSVHARRRRCEPECGVDRRASFLAVFCIDDREESIRRHLEEVAPDGETASAAGFYAVAMYYRGADQAHYRPLCPNVITPQHYVCETPLFSAIDSSQRRAEHRRRLGRVTHGLHMGSRTMIGGWLTALFGAVATFPLVTRILAPRLTSRVRQSMGTYLRPAATELMIERTAAEPGPEPESALGYSLAEMADIVARVLQDIGKVRELPPLVVFFGHGSSSLNNPHESAYNCGACSGGRGGPNARAFATMANSARVRKLLTERGLDIPVDVHFLGAYHNTCSDNVQYYDLDLVPRTHRRLFREIESHMNTALQRNALERSRRFESAPLDLTPAEALEHVEQRAEDLSQARPEYNHATNSMVLVGRRHWSRGLFLDRRAFLTSYDPRTDDEEATILARILQAAIPVCAGISLEYYFSTVDPEGYGCGSKLPHNITSMLGVMTGAASDLRPGLSTQMVEIHEPMRILFVIETTSEKMLGIMNRNETIERLVRNRWVQLALIDPATGDLQFLDNGTFVPRRPESDELPLAESSTDWYRGRRDHLGFCSIGEATERAMSDSPVGNASGVGGCVG